MFSNSPCVWKILLQPQLRYFFNATLYGAFREFQLPTLFHAQLKDLKSSLFLFKLVKFSILVPKGIGKAVIFSCLLRHTAEWINWEILGTYRVLTQIHVHITVVKPCQGRMNETSKQAEIENTWTIDALWLSLHKKRATLILLGTCLMKRSFIPSMETNLPSSQPCPHS